MILKAILDRLPGVKIFKLFFVGFEMPNRILIRALEKNNNCFCLSLGLNVGMSIGCSGTDIKSNTIS